MSKFSDIQTLQQVDTVDGVVQRLGLILDNVRFNGKKGWSNQDRLKAASLILEVKGAIGRNTQIAIQNRVESTSNICPEDMIRAIRELSLKDQQAKQSPNKQV